MTVTTIGNPTGSTVNAAEWRSYIESGAAFSGTTSVVNGKYRLAQSNQADDPGYHKVSMESVATFTRGEVRADITIVAEADRIVLGAYSESPYDAPYANSPINGYAIRITAPSGLVALDKLTGETQRDIADAVTNTPLASANVTPFATGTVIHMALRAETTGLRAWVWRDAEARPATPTFSINGETKYASGEVRISMQGSGPSTTATTDWVVVHDDLVGVGATLGTESFPTNGAWPTSNWDAPFASGSAGATVVGNRGRLAASFAGGYVDRVFVPVKSSVVPLATSDQEMSGTMWWQNRIDTETYVEVMLRSTGSGSTGYGLVFRNDGQVSFKKDGNDTAGGYSSAGHPTFGIGVGRKFRFQVVGTTLRYKLWSDQAAEPATWTREWTDPAAQPIQAGRMQVAAYGGNTGVSGGVLVDLDDLTFYGVAPAAPSQVTYVETTIFSDDGSKGAGVTPVGGGLYDVETKNDTSVWAYTGAGYLNLPVNDGFARHRARTTYNAQPDYQRIRTAFQYRGSQAKYHGVLFRSSGTPLYGGTDQAFEEDAYFVSHRSADGKVVLERSDGANIGELSSVPVPNGSYVSGDTAELIIDSIRTATDVTIKVKHWKRGTAEPTSGGADDDGFQLRYTDTSALRKNGSRLSLFGGSSQIGEAHWLDYLTVAHLVPSTVTPDAGADRTVPAGSVVTLVGTPAGGTWTQDSGDAVTLSAPVSNGTDTRVTFTSTNASTTTSNNRVFRYTVASGSTAPVGDSYTVGWSGKNNSPTTTRPENTFYRITATGTGSIEADMTGVASITGPGTYDVTFRVRIGAGSARDGGSSANYGTSGGGYLGNVGGDAGWGTMTSAWRDVVHRYVVPAGASTAARLVLLPYWYNAVAGDAVDIDPTIKILKVA